MVSEPADSRPENFNPLDFNPLELARELMFKAGAATLATLEPDGEPLATLTVTALDKDGIPLIFISSLSGHTQNLLRDPRFSLLLALYGKGDPLAHPRLTLNGSATVTHDGAAKERYIKQNPKARLYADFADFSLWRLVPDKLHLNGGFARAYSGPAAELLEFLK